MMQPTTTMAATIMAIVMLVMSSAASGAPKPSDQIMILANRCAPQVDPLTIGFLVAHESSNDRLAINVNGGGSYRPKTAKQARARVRELQNEGANYDVGYGQINSANFARLGVTGETLFDGCENLAAAAQILEECYTRATPASVTSQAALRSALSCYNTGNLRSGYENGYVASVQRIADDYAVPQLKAMGVDEAVSAPKKQEGDEPAFAGDGSGAFSSPDGGAFAHPQDTTTATSTR